MASAQNDFSKGSVVGNIMGMAIPMTAAQLINLLYNVVDRIYIGYIPEHATLSLTGLGVCLPVITAVMAFANLFGMGGAPLCSIERGRGNQKEAEAIMGNAFTLMVICGILLTILGIVFRRPLLYLFGASDSTYPYAESYMTIYLLGSVFVMMGLGMNAFINSQGFGRIGMQTVLLGAVANIILDPVFIFGFRMDVRGAALATIISQFLSAAWVLRFLFSDRSILRLKRETMVLKKARVLKIVSMGMSSFAAGFTNSVVAVACNATLQTWGGDLYVGVMTVIHSVREIADYQFPGIWADRDADSAPGGCGQHHPGPCVHFRFSHGCPGSSPGHDHFPVFIGGVGAEVPVQRQEHPAAETGDHGAEKSPGAEDRFHGHVQLCRRFYQQCGGGGLQRNASDLGRGSVCGSYDGDPFREGDSRKSGEGPYGRLPAGAGL